MKDNMPHVFRSVLLSILHSVIFLLTYFFAATVLILIVLLLSYIPIINKIALLILDFLDRRGDGFSGFSAYLSLGAAYFVAEKLLLLITKHGPTRWLSFKLSGIWLMIYGVITLVLNLLAGEDGAWLICLAFAGAGFLVYISSQKYEKEPTNHSIPMATPISTPSDGDPDE